MCSLQLTTDVTYGFIRYGYVEKYWGAAITLKMVLIGRNYSIHTNSVDFCRDFSTTMHSILTYSFRHLS